MPVAAGLSYAVHGGGSSPERRPPLVLIHGAGGSRLSWPPELRRLEGERVYAIDLPGHGRSEGEGEATISGYFERVHDWARAIGIERAVLVGHSMGGAIALTAALRIPTRVAGLVVVASGAALRVNPTILEGTADIQRLAQTVGAIISWSFAPQAPPQLVERARAQMLETAERVLHQDFQACDRFDVLDRLAEISTPTLVICGREDKMTPAADNQKLAEAIPGARFEAIQGAGHMVMLERPALVAAAVKRFVGGLAGR